MKNRRTWVFICGTLALFSAGRREGRAAEGPMLEPATLGSTRNVHAHGTTLLCGQPSPADLAAAKEQGVQLVLTLRGEDEIDWDEQSEARRLGLRFQRVDFQGPDSLTDAVFDQTRQILRGADAENQPVMLHCGSANRVGAIWLVYRVLDQGTTLAEAEREAREIGLRTEGYLVRAKQYIQARN